MKSFRDSSRGAKWISCIHSCKWGGGGPFPDMQNVRLQAFPVMSAAPAHILARTPLSESKPTTASTCNFTARICSCRANLATCHGRVLAHKHTIWNCLCHMRQADQTYLACPKSIWGPLGTSRVPASHQEFLAHMFNQACCQCFGFTGLPDWHKSAQRKALQTSVLLPSTSHSTK